MKASVVLFPITTSFVVYYGGGKESPFFFGASDAFGFLAPTAGGGGEAFTSTGVSSEAAAGLAFWAFGAAAFSSSPLT